VKIPLIFLISLWWVSPISARREIRWEDIAPPVQQLLIARGITRSTLASHLADQQRRNQERVRDGDLDHLVYYALQSTSFTKLPPIEPAASAADFDAGAAVPRNVRARLDAFVKAVGDGPPRTPLPQSRMTYFRAMLERQSPRRETWPAFVSEQYVRAMRFFKRPDYQGRGLSTDTSIDAGYVVDVTLAALRQLEPQRRIRSVLIVGPGLNLAPRTGHVDAAAPQSWQPFAILDTLLRLGLAERTDVRITAADINPRVVGWLTQVRGTRPVLTAVSGLADTKTVTLADDYRAYFATLGGSIGEPQNLTVPGRLAKSIIVNPGLSDRIDAVELDVVAGRLEAQFDVVVVTNVFPYLSDADLLLAISNIVAMLAPGGVLLHNEPRPLLADASLALNLPLLHARSAVIANVEGTSSPMYDAVWMHVLQMERKPR
jgi:hypothetical protein